MGNFSFTSDLARSAHILRCVLQCLQETPDTVVDPSFCGPVLESEPKCMLHSKRPKKMVAFEGTLTGRRFLGCSEQVCIFELEDVLVFLLFYVI